jgi:hypothetical protein
MKMFDIFLPINLFPVLSQTAFSGFTQNKTYDQTNYSWVHTFFEKKFTKKLQERRWKRQEVIFSVQVKMFLCQPTPTTKS